MTQIPYSSPLLQCQCYRIYVDRLSSAGAERRAGVRGFLQGAHGGEGKEKAAEWCSGFPTCACGRFTPGQDAAGRLRGWEWDWGVETEEYVVCRSRIELIGVASVWGLRAEWLILSVCVQPGRFGRRLCARRILSVIRDWPLPVWLILMWLLMACG